MEKEEVLDEKKIEEALKIVEEVDVLSLMKVVIQLLKVYAVFGEKVGELQRDNEDAFEAFGYLGSIAPQFMQSLAKRSPPAEFGAFVKAFMELLELVPKLDKFMKLPAEEKVAVGKQLGKIADTFDELVRNMQEKKEEEGK